MEILFSKVTESFSGPAQFIFAAFSARHMLTATNKPLSVEQIEQLIELVRENTGRSHGKYKEQMSVKNL